MAIPNLIQDWLRAMVQKGASDLFLTAGFPPALKLDGRITPIGDKPLLPTETQALAKTVMTEKQWTQFSLTKEANFAIQEAEAGRFRVSVFVQQGRVGIVFRHINTRIPELHELGLPGIMRDISLMPRGLVLLVGGTGTGKSTTLAAMMGYRNRNRADHILTVEDPIEFVHEHDKCVITQREVGSDTESWEVALKNSLRQAPDVILIGEVRDRGMMEFAMGYAETGHLCLTTLHANNAEMALERIVSFFPMERRDQLLLDLAMNLKAIVSQRLVPRADGEGRVVAVEVMVVTPFISELILKGRIGDIKGMMARSVEMGMQTFDQALYDLHNQGLITGEEALRNADSFNDLRLKIKLKSSDYGAQARPETGFGGLG
jgi:twitching motility protein PilU